MKNVLFIIYLMFIFSLQAAGQEKQEIGESDYTNSSVEMADTFREEGKIYVVVAVILAILAGLFIYLVIIDRRLRKMEKQWDKSDN